MNENWPLTEHWKRDHTSNGITELQVQYLLENSRPLKARICKNCGWPGSKNEICLLCCDMVEALLPQKGLLEAHENWRVRNRLKNMGLL